MLAFFLGYSSPYQNGPHPTQMMPQPQHMFYPGGELLSLLADPAGRALTPLLTSF